MGKRRIAALLGESSLKNAFYLPGSVTLDRCLPGFVGSRAEQLWKGEAT